MELNDALRQMRIEIGMTQNELAVAVHMGFAAINRWENQNSRPNKAASIALMELAKQHHVSTACLDTLSRELFAPRAKAKDDQELREQVTEAMKIENRELLTSEQLRMAIDNLDVAVIAQRVYHNDTNKLDLFYYNTSYPKILGYDQAEFSELINMAPHFAIEPEAFRDYIQQVKQLIAKKISCREFDATVQATKKDGTKIWLSVKALSLKEFTFGFEFFVTCRNITGEHESREIQNHLLSAMPGGAIIYKFGKTIETLFYSDGVTKNNGYSKEEYIALVKGDPINSIVYENDRPEVERIVLSAVAQSKPFNLTFRIRAKNGTLVWRQMSASMVREDLDGKIYYATCLQPAANTEIYRNVVEHSNVAVVLAEISTRQVIFANRAWKHLYGINPQANISGEKIIDLISPDSLFFSEDELLALPYNSFVESQGITVRGKHLRLRRRRIDWNGYAAYICYFIDETEQWEHHQQLQNLINEIPCGISIYEIDNQSVRRAYSNDRHFGRMDGFLREISKDAIAAVHPMDQGIIQQAVEKVRGGDDSFDISFRIPDQSGAYRWLRCIGSVAQRKDEKITVYCCYSDFDAYFKSQQELKRNRAMLQQAMKVAKAIVWKYDYRTHTIQCNDWSSLGLNLPSEIGNVPESLIQNGIIQARSSEVIRELYADDNALRQVQNDVYAMADGHYAWYRQILTPVFDLEGNYVETLGMAINITEQKLMEESYAERIRIKSLFTRDCVAVAHFNLTRNSVTDVESGDADMVKLLKSESVDDALKRIVFFTIEASEQAKFDCIKNHEAMLACYYTGKRHVSIRHHRADDSRWYESTFDLVNNPHTGEIEAIAILRDVTSPALAENAVAALLETDYQEITAINANTGELYPYTNGHFDIKSSEQRKADDYSMGVEMYFRNHCADEDVDRIIRESSLPNVKEQLEKNKVLTIACSVREKGSVRKKKAFYTFLDDSHRFILCAVRNITEEKTGDC